MWSKTNEGENIFEMEDIHNKKIIWNKNQKKKEKEIYTDKKHTQKRKHIW